MFNEKFLFGFLNLGDDMLFPDWGNKKEVSLTRQQSHTLEQDSFIVHLYNENNADYAGSSALTIDGVSPFQGSGAYNNYTCFYCKAGSVISTTLTTTRSAHKLLIFPLVKGGGN